MGRRCGESREETRYDLVTDDMEFDEILLAAVDEASDAYENVAVSDELYLLLIFNQK